MFRSRTPRLAKNEDELDRLCSLFAAHMAGVRAEHISTMVAAVAAYIRVINTDPANWAQEPTGIDKLFVHRVAEAFQSAARAIERAHAELYGGNQ